MERAKTYFVQEWHKWKSQKIKLHNFFFFQIFFFKDIFQFRLHFLATNFKPLANFKSSKFHFCSAWSTYLLDSKLPSLITSSKKDFFVIYLCKFFIQVVYLFIFLSFLQILFFFLLKGYIGSEWVKSFVMGTLCVR